MVYLYCRGSRAPSGRALTPHGGAMKRGRRLKGFAYSIGTGIFAVFLFMLFYFAANKNVAPFILILREVFPLYEDAPAAVVNLYAFGGLFDDIEEDGQTAQYDDSIETIPGDIDRASIEYDAEEGGDMGVAAETTEPANGIIGLKNVVYQPETELGTNENPQTDLLTKADMEKFKDFDYLKSALYTVDKRTVLLPEDINVDEFVHMNFKIGGGDGPKALIIHTHSQEAYRDSRARDLSDGIFLAGDRLAELLNTKYGIETLHDKTSYDIVDGESCVLGAYERMEESVAKILERYPGIELVIDLHRDGVADNVHFVTNVDGKPTAKIMFFNGLCRVLSDGELTPTSGLSNSYIKENLAFSLDLQLLANELFPGFTRKIYINAYRYSLHFKPKSVLVEVGAQTNTKEEALNAMEPLAEILAKTVKN